jgi:3-oxoacyl-[acyl-carrier-protein] synthase-3
MVSHADGLIQIGAASNVLVIAISILTREIHENDKPNRFIFGDGACAFIVEKSEKARFHSYYFGNDGANRNKIIVLDGESRNPISKDSFTPFTNSYGEEQIPACFYQHGAGVFRFTLDRVPKMIKHILEQNQLTPDDIDLYLLHQPNEFIVENLAKIAGLPKEKVVIDVADYGNTVSVTIPTLVHNLIKKNQLKPGMKILVAAFGTGLSWNGCIWET